MIENWKKTDPNRPLVKIGTENDDDPPLIIEHPDRFPFAEGEREEYRPATDEEYRRYQDYYNAEYDAEHGLEDPPLWGSITAVDPAEKRRP